MNDAIIAAWIGFFGTIVGAFVPVLMSRDSSVNAIKGMSKEKLKLLLRYLAVGFLPAAVLVGGSIYLIVRPSPPPSLTITSPRAEGAVDTQEGIDGTAKDLQPGVLVWISIGIKGRYYPQNANGAIVGVSGSWSASGTFGEQNTPPGTRFTVYATVGKTTSVNDVFKTYFDIAPRVLGGLPGLTTLPKPEDAVTQTITVCRDIPCGTPTPTSTPTPAPGAALKITSVPAYGTAGAAIGRALNVDPAKYQVAVYIFVAGSWWTKPSFLQPATAIAQNGSWSCNITTGGDDIHATVIRAYLISKTFSPPVVQNAATLPTELDQQAVAKAEKVRNS